MLESAGISGTIEPFLPGPEFGALSAHSPLYQPRNASSLSAFLPPLVGTISNRIPPKRFVVISRPQASIYLCRSPPLEPNLLLFSITILSISSHCENPTSQSIPPTTWLWSFNIQPPGGPRQMTMSAVAASTGSPNERRASASRSFSQSQDENTKLPDEMTSPELKKVRPCSCFTFLLLVCGGWKLLPSPAEASEPCRSLTATNRNMFETKGIAAHCQVPAQALWQQGRRMLTRPAHSRFNTCSTTSGSRSFSFRHLTHFWSQSLL